MSANLPTDNGQPKPKKAYYLIIKWFITGFLATLTLMIAATCLLIWQFSPLISIDERAGRVELLGGLIDINSNNEMNFSWSNHQELDVSGTKSVDTGTVKYFEIEISNSHVELINSEDDELSWQCRGIWKQDPLVTEAEDTIKLGGDNVNAHCRIGIPNGLKVSFKTQNGKLSVVEPHFDLDVDAINGKVEIAPAHDARYKYTLKVNNGKVDNFESSNAQGAYKISVSVVNGMIGKG